MKLFNNLNKKLPKKEKELIQNIGNNLLSLIDKSLEDKEKCNTVDIYIKEINEYKNSLENLKNENKKLLEELKILRNNEMDLKNKNQELTNINILIDIKLNELEKKISKYILEIGKLTKLNKKLNDTLNNTDKSEKSYDKMILMLFKAYDIIVNDLKQLIINLYKPVISIKSEINKVMSFNSSSFVYTIKINDAKLRIDHTEYVDILNKPTFETEFESFINDKVKVILDNINKLKQPPYHNLELLEQNLIKESNELRNIYNTINYIYIFYNNQLTSNVVKLADKVLKK
jgi:hypothetical protein